jgi:hypothetical protein
MWASYNPEKKTRGNRNFKTIRRISKGSWKTSSKRAWNKKEKGTWRIRKIKKKRTAWQRIWNGEWT